MNRLAIWLIRAQFAARRTASGLAMLAIALGVALGYAVHLINDAALADFAQALRVVQGEADAVLAPREAGGAITPPLVESIARDPSVALVAGVIDLKVRVDETPNPVRLIGLDPLAAALTLPRLLPASENEIGRLLDGAVFASPPLYTRLGAASKTIRLTRGEAAWSAPLAGELPAAGDEALLVADIAWVQAHFGPHGGIGELRIRLAPDTVAADWIAARAATLPGALLLRAAGDERVRASNLSRAYRVNLNVLALVALLTGGFLVFATQLVAVAQRGGDFALLGVLGLSPRRRLQQVLLEGAALGLPGALLGLALGYGFAVAFTTLAGGDLGGGYFGGAMPTIRPQVLPALGFLALGLATSLGGAAYPAWLNARQPLARALKTGFVAPAAPTRRATRRYWLLVAMAGAALALTRLPPVFDLPLGGYAAIALVLALGVLVTPPLSAAIFTALARRPQPPARQIALQNLAQAPLMAQVAASGLLVSFALTVSMVTMVASFRGALDHWLDGVLPAPLYLRAKGVPLPGEALAAINAPAAPYAKVQRGSTSPLTLDPRKPPVSLLVRDIDPSHPGERLPFTGATAEAGPGEIRVWISEAVQDLYGWQVGQRVVLPVGAGGTVVVGGVWRDYARQFGAIAVAEADYRTLAGPAAPPFAPNELALWPTPGKESAAKALLESLVAAHRLEMSDSGELRRLSLAIFDRSFAVTYALEAAALLIGLFGLAVTLAAGVWLRARELATLNALGFDRALLTRAVLFEGALIAALGLSIGLLCGLAVGAVLTHVINPQAFHWRMALAIPWGEIAAAAGLTLAAGLAASRLAARQVTRLPSARVLAGAQ